MPNPPLTSLPVPDQPACDATPDINALLGSRICHDLISPLGAIANGVELLLMSGGAATPEVALIAESVANANARIRFFRVAFGSASSDQRMGRPEVTAILTDVTTGGRLSFDWLVPGDVPRTEVRLAFLAMQCCETAMPYGGRISFGRDAGRWTIKATATRLKLETDLWAAVQKPAPMPQVSSAQVHFPLFAAGIAAQRRALQIDLSPAAITIQF